MESSDYERGWNEKNKDVEDSQEGLKKVIEGLTIEHLDAVQNIATSINTGYSEAENGAN